MMYPNIIFFSFRLMYSIICVENKYYVCLEIHFVNLFWHLTVILTYSLYNSPKIYTDSLYEYQSCKRYAVVHIAVSHRVGGNRKRQYYRRTKIKNR